MLSDRCPICLSVCLSVLSVTLVYCDQTVGWIQMKLGVQVDLGHGHIVLDRDPAPLSQRGTASPNFRPMCIVAKRSPISATAEQLYKVLNFAGSAEIILARGATMKPNQRRDVTECRRSAWHHACNIISTNSQQLAQHRYNATVRIFISPAVASPS